MFFSSIYMGGYGNLAPLRFTPFHSISLPFTTFRSIPYSNPYMNLIRFSNSQSSKTSSIGADDKGYCSLHYVSLRFAPVPIISPPIFNLAQYSSHPSFSCKNKLLKSASSNSHHYITAPLHHCTTLHRINSWRVENLGDDASAPDALQHHLVSWALREDDCLWTESSQI
jgi:hypothetical protein